MCLSQYSDRTSTMARRFAAYFLKSSGAEATTKEARTFQKDFKLISDANNIYDKH